MTERLLLNLIAASLGLAVFLFGAAACGQQDSDEQRKSWAGDEPAPAFPDGLDWINTGGRELDLETLRGKVVLLDFWTYGCINCMHVIPDLKKLEATYGDALVVIGVHTGKFETERRTANIRDIVDRYNRGHPVVNDAEYQFWKRYGVRAWPTLALIDPAGNIVGKVEGEGHYQTLDRIIGSLVEEFRAKGELDTEPLPFEATADTDGDTFLRFPGKVLADHDNDRLFVADTNHHRIVIASRAGEVRHIIGTGAPGLTDGAYDEARFRHPQGMALHGDTLYVADTGNHAIRRVDLAGRSVTTVAGTGEQGYLRGDEIDGNGHGLNSPWDVLWAKGRLYIAMAGQHQLWTLEPGSGKLTRFAGTGREALDDGARLSAAMNQPSGLATDGEYLYVADAEASAVRRVPLTGEGDLTTLVGTGLFDFGDRDGVGDEVRLQHVLGLAWHDGALYLADTYNDKIKRLDPASRRVETVTAANGRLDEPGGLSAAGGRLWIADTNRHAIRVMSLPDGEVKTVSLQTGKAR